MKGIDDTLEDILLQRHGIDVSNYDKDFLEKSFQKSMGKMIHPSIENYLTLLRQNPEEAAAFAASLQVNYSKFFRNPLTFSVLEKMILPSLLRRNMEKKNNMLRFWSAACAAGQEAYSLAMLLEELNANAEHKSRYMIFATDINETSLKLAANGTYTVEELQDLILERAGRWFHEQGNTYVINPDLKKNINFSVFNLADDRWSSPPASIFGKFDLVFCANLLFYYKESCRTAIIEKISNCIPQGGFLVTGETEREIIMKYNYREYYPHSAIFQKC
jgi:chemotaxis methyl-accepting protein methylase